MRVLHYQTPEGADPFDRWLRGLADRQAQARVLARTNRLILTGNLGDFKGVGEGVLELRIDYGPGYRVYCGRSGAELVLLLVGGDKRTQKADIRTAQAYWRDWQQRSSK
ncbi:Addiction module killer protein [Thiomonas sp. X19]|uniref:type II toxin-antitoxin system RelE/ParE family toxin n=1 Tax=Thiomonas sp. X19 TaxID=1050370 RepID=UPI000B69EA52|nr:type II toxin-antitoxin system RelE/ParE family toxin [Thiomonas sp. X19]SCC92443.1 Addiction module killer protein [Thiomonas sp. X19]